MGNCCRGNATYETINIERHQPLSIDHPKDRSSYKQINIERPQDVPSKKVTPDQVRDEFICMDEKVVYPMYRSHPVRRPETSPSTGWLRYIGYGFIRESQLQFKK